MVRFRRTSSYRPRHRRSVRLARPVDKPAQAPRSLPHIIAACFIGVVSSWSVAAHALTPLELLEFSPDIAIRIGSENELVRDQDAAADDLAGSVAAIALSGVGEDADLVGYHVDTDGSILVAFDVAVVFPDLTSRAADVVRLQGDQQSLEFDAAAAGVPDGVSIDAVSMVGGELVLSFDTTTELPGGLTIADEDLIRFDGVVFSAYFDGSEAGIPEALDLDAADVLPNGNILVSFDGGGVVDDITFDDEDVLEFDPFSMSWELAYDGEARHGAWPPADLVALDATAASTTTTTTTTTTSTTTTSTTTTTTVPLQGNCADPNDDGAVTATDALFILRAGVGSETCADCVCDANGSGSVTATDALLALQVAVGLDVPLNCPPCT